MGPGRGREARGRDHGACGQGRPRPKLLKHCTLPLNRLGRGSDMVITELARVHPESAATRPASPLIELADGVNP